MRFAFFIALILSTLLCSAQTYITNVSVLDVERMKMIPAQTLVFDNGYIIQMGAAKTIKVPPGVSTVDATGRFAMPGMVDAHVHFFQSGGLYARPDAIPLQHLRSYEKEIEWVHRNMEDQLRRYLAAGITTVIDVGATINFLKQKDSFADKAYAPAIYMTGPLITSYMPEVYTGLKNDQPFYPAATPEEGREYVQKQLPFKPDLIKIWYIVQGSDLQESAETYLPVVKAVIEEAHKHHLPVAVHATERITAQLAVASGADFLVHSIDDEIVSDEFIALLRKHKTVVCPTLVVAGNYAKVFAQKPDFLPIDFKLANPQMLGTLSDLKHLADTALVKRYLKVGEWMLSAQSKADSIQQQNLLRMVRNGIPVATGTDAGNIGTLHASSYYHELQAMKEGGLSNWEILQASTLHGAKAIGKENEFGSIQKGKRADILLLDENPAENLDNLRKIHLVVNKGKVIHPDKQLSATPESLVQQQLNAYNARDLEGFLAPYDEETEIYAFPDTLQATGKSVMRQMYAPMFRNIKDLHCEVTSRIVQGNIVIDHERVTGIGKNAVYAIAIYHIENGKIKKVYFIQ